MKHEHKNLLLKDLCARLPYGVRCSFGVDDAVYEVCGINPSCCGASEIQATHIKSSINGDFKLTSCKPYLFPMSSMTEEDKFEFRKLTTDYDNKESMGNFMFRYEELLEELEMIGFFPYEIYDWLNANHFDYRGLIEKGLALDATNLGIY